MKRMLVGVAAAFVFAAAPAAAEGLPPISRIAAPAPVVPNWNGFYVGVGVGGGAAVQDLSITCTICHYEVGSFNFDGIGGEGFFGTVTVGADRVIAPGWVAGVFADYDFSSSISTDVSATLFGYPLVDASIDHNYSWAVGGRLGYLVNPSTLVYGTGGYTEAEFDYAGLTSQTFRGYFAGAGIETFLRQNVTLKLEYRFSQFESETLLDWSCPTIDLEPSMHTARLVLSYKFGGHREEANSIKD